MAGGIQDSDDDVIAGINITPLVDVVLVLLIIFLITAPAIYQSAIKVQLPKAASGDKTQRSPMEFTVSHDGNVYWGKDSLDWKALEERIKKLDPASKQETVFISADQNTPHGTVIRLMDLLRMYDVTRFTLTVEGNK